MFQPQWWVNFKLSQAHPPINVIRIDKLDKALWWICFFLQFQQTRKRFLSSKDMSNDVEVTGFVYFHIDLDDLTLYEHQILVSIIAPDRYPKISLAQ